MRNHITHIGIAVLIAGVAVGCSRGGDHSYRSEGGRGNSPADQFIKLDGCLQPGTTADGEFTLRDIVVPEPATQPIGQETMERPPIPAGSWVRLVGDKDDLTNNLGKRVEVTGRVQDSGANTLGTAGHTTATRDARTNHDKFEQSSHDASTTPDRNMNPTTSAPGSANANGMAPRLAVEHVKKIADSCQQKTADGEGSR